MTRADEARQAAEVRAQERAERLRDYNQWLCDDAWAPTVDEIAAAEDEKRMRLEAARMGVPTVRDYHHP